ncbi:WD domain, G-beta repeat-containing protein [Toxoplasma gondii GAB2-2007-GAL-DOM2]|uniref:WD domain, G-beta repeat-containing protein n=5 Tax=Toxoplasma gondii TaxID=5811 RepID=V4ZHR6_TOXGV|nr:WD domain, G-beta repeat-containing protein [Toxoplasma gondii VEG]KFG30933.1 WD domain, G-beta repeat-containing protein [Toxoplasma gondii GAB2-2007-GAL-DOM2]KFG34932.1 WD domain, G-beta repeat-containing protein [Toxoplasma gondii p89]CEL74115.1 TPA: WD domain, G-beta repeat-containing protein [Toxoplasma gondii VEG]
MQPGKSLSHAGRRRQQRQLEASPPPTSRVPARQPPRRGMFIPACSSGDPEAAPQPFLGGEASHFPGRSSENGLRPRKTERVSRNGEPIFDPDPEPLLSGIKRERMQACSGLAAAFLDLEGHFHIRSTRASELGEEQLRLFSRLQEGRSRPWREPSCDVSAATHSSFCAQNPEKGVGEAAELERTTSPACRERRTGGEEENVSDEEFYDATDACDVARDAPELSFSPRRSPASARPAQGGHDEEATSSCFEGERSWPLLKRREHGDASAFFTTREGRSTESECSDARGRQRSAYDQARVVRQCSFTTAVEAYFPTADKESSVGGRLLSRRSSSVSSLEEGVHTLYRDAGRRGLASEKGSEELRNSVATPRGEFLAAFDATGLRFQQHNVESRQEKIEQENEHGRHEDTAEGVTPVDTQGKESRDSRAGCGREKIDESIGSAAEESSRVPGDRETNGLPDGELRHCDCSESPAASPFASSAVSTSVAPALSRFVSLGSSGSQMLRSGVSSVSLPSKRTWMTRSVNAVKRLGGRRQLSGESTTSTRTNLSATGASSRMVTTDGKTATSAVPRSGGRGAQHAGADYAGLHPFPAVLKRSVTKGNKHQPPLSEVWCVRAIETGDRAALWATAISPAGDWLAAAGQTGVISLWSVPSLCVSALSRRGRGEDKRGRKFAGSLTGKGDSERPLPQRDGAHLSMKDADKNEMTHAETVHLEEVDGTRRGRTFREMRTRGSHDGGRSTATDEACEQCQSDPGTLASHAPDGGTPPQEGHENEIVCRPAHMRASSLPVSLSSASNHRSSPSSRLACASHLRRRNPRGVRTPDSGARPLRPFASLPGERVGVVGRGKAAVCGFPAERRTRSDETSTPAAAAAAEETNGSEAPACGGDTPESVRAKAPVGAGAKKAFSRGLRAHTEEGVASLLGRGDREAGREKREEANASRRQATPWFISNRPTLCLTGHSAAIIQLVWAPTQKAALLLSASLDKTVRLWWPAKQPEAVAVLRCRDWPTSVAFHPTFKNVVFTGCLDATVQVWRLFPVSDSSGARAREDRGRREEGSRQKEGKTLWDARVVEYLKVTELVTAISLSPNGSVLAVGFRNGTIAFYDAQTLKFRNELDCRNRKGKFSKGRKVTSLEWHASGLALCVTTNDSRIRIFRATDLSCVAKFKGHINEQIMLRANYTNEGTGLVCGSENGWICCWNVADPRSSIADGVERRFRGNVLSSKLSIPATNRRPTNANFAGIKAFTELLTCSLVAPASFASALVSRIGVHPLGSPSAKQTGSRRLSLRKFVFRSDSGVSAGLRGVQGETTGRSHSKSNLDRLSHAPPGDRQETVTDGFSSGCLPAQDSALPRDPRCLLLPPSSCGVADSRPFNVGKGELVDRQGSHLAALKAMCLPKYGRGSPSGTLGSLPAHASEGGEEDLDARGRSLDKVDFLGKSSLFSSVNRPGSDSPVLYNGGSEAPYSRPPSECGSAGFALAAPGLSGFPAKDLPLKAESPSSGASTPGRGDYGGAFCSYLDERRKNQEGDRYYHEGEELHIALPASVYREECRQRSSSTSLPLVVVAGSHHGKLRIFVNFGQELRNF